MDSGDVCLLSGQSRGSSEDSDFEYFLHLELKHAVFAASKC
jgi:hypothetical protein